MNTKQQRIVANVDELLRWCDTLETQSHPTRTFGAHLLAAPSSASGGVPPRLRIANLKQSKT